jgi:hypothetical protein
MRIVSNRVSKSSARKMKGFRQALLYVLLGGLSFWLPDIFLTAKRQESLALHTVFPIIGLLGCYLIVRLAFKNYAGPSIAMFMMLGIWGLGSTAMMVGQSFGGGGFATGISDSLIVIALGLLPPYTLIMATYDASIFGLLIGVSLMVGAHGLLERHRWVLPPSVQAWLRRFYYSPDHDVEDRH